jgi:hypothetical protein
MRSMLAAFLTVSVAILSDVQEAAQAAEAEAQQVDHFLPALSVGDQRFWIVTMLILLMGFLFGILFWWQKWIEQAGYFAPIYRDAIADIETNRLSQPYQKRWNQQIYWEEIVVRPSERAQKWLDQNKKPEPKPELTRLAEKLRLEYMLPDLERPPFAMLPGLGGEPVPGYSGYYGSSTGNLFPTSKRPGSWPAMSETVAEGSEALAEEQPNQDQLKFQELFSQFREEATAWARRASVEAWNFYQKDLKGAQEEGRDQAKRAMQVDLSALRGRGPEFVLEFTAIVVIIFAAAILGVMGLLGSNQIGTLLAAIAGYVLGKSVAGTRSGQTEEPNRLDQGGKEGRS